MRSNMPASQTTQASVGNCHWRCCDSSAADNCCNSRTTSNGSGCANSCPDSNRANAKSASIPRCMRSVACCTWVMPCNSALVSPCAKARSLAARSSATGVRSSCATLRDSRRSRCASSHELRSAVCAASTKGCSSCGVLANWPACGGPSCGSRCASRVMWENACRTTHKHNNTAAPIAAKMPTSKMPCMRRSVLSQLSRSVATNNWPPTNAPCDNRTKR